MRDRVARDPARTCTRDGPRPRQDSRRRRGTRLRGESPSRGVVLARRTAAPPRVAGRSAIFWLAHVAFWATACAVNFLLAAVFEVDDPAAFIVLEGVLCFVATAVMRALSHREPLLAGLNATKAGLIAGGAIFSTALIAGVLLAVRPWLGPPAPLIRRTFESVLATRSRARRPPSAPAATKTSSPTWARSRTVLRSTVPST